ncbi:MAG: cytochrome c [Gammaproteobacteria bacterium]|nr:cytochrome c [Gammaproteobacteria bacterium]
MKIQLIRKVAFVAGFSAIILCGQAMAEAASGSSREPLDLQKIMFDMDKNMQNITAGISSENWVKVEKSAMKIADHPKPPMSERIRIMKLMGPEMARFKDSDMKTHAAARELAKIAKGHDGRAVISAFATLQNTCLTCHESYRKKLKNHFYGQR